MFDVLQRLRNAGLASLFTVLTLAGCGGGGGGSTPSPQPAPAPTPTVSAAITGQPADQSVVVGSTATFTVVATDASTYQWQVSSDSGTTYTDVAGATAASYTTAATALGDSGRQYRAVAANSVGAATSNAATLLVTSTLIAPSISVQPAGQTIVEGQNASFAVTAAGTGVAYQWQRSTAGATFSDEAGATGATLNLAAVALTSNGHRFRVVVSNSGGSVTSNAALLTVNAVGTAAPTFTSQPASTTVVEPNAATFSVAVSGTPAPTVFWQVSVNNGGTWVAIAGATGTSYTTPPTVLGHSGRLYRAAVSNSVGSGFSAAAVLTVNAAPIAPAFTMQPANASVVAPGVATFSVVVTGSPTPALQWQISGNSGATWASITNATASSYTTPATATTDSGRWYRAVATNTASTVPSNAAVLTVTAPPAGPTTVVLYPVNDNTIGSSSLNATPENSVYQFNYGFPTPGIGVGCVHLYGVITLVQNLNCARGLVKFNLAALAGKNIQSATLSLTASAHAVLSGVGVGRFPDPWYVAASASPWAGNTVTWLNYGEQIYTASVTYWNPPNFVGQVFNSDQTVTVRNWLSGFYANNGFAMGLQIPSGLTREQVRLCGCDSFDAFEFFSNEDPTVARRPTLTVTYQ